MAHSGQNKVACPAPPPLLPLRRVQRRGEEESAAKPHDSRRGEDCDNGRRRHDRSWYTNRPVRIPVATPGADAARLTECRPAGSAETEGAADTAQTIVVHGRPVPNPVATPGADAAGASARHIVSADPSLQPPHQVNRPTDHMQPPPFASGYHFRERIPVDGGGDECEAIGDGNVE